jgi:hypothetical protein
LPAFNTAAGEKINADKHLSRMPRADGGGYDNTRQCAIPNQTRVLCREFLGVVAFKFLPAPPSL